MACPLDVEGGRREVGAEVDAPHGIDFVQAAYPNCRLAKLLFELLPLFLSQSFKFLWAQRLSRTIGVVSLVVDNQNVFLATKLLKHAATEGGVALWTSLDYTSGAAVVLRLKEVPIGDLEFA